jgi:C4-dicarboxylate transporter/malic acid transport protein
MTMTVTRTLDRALAVPRRPASLLSGVGPNWFTPVMGTGIVATAAVSLPHRVSGLHDCALCVWMLAASLLIVVLAATVAHWALHPTQARAHLGDRVIGHFYGAPPMAALTVGAGALLLGRDLIGLHAALTVDWVLWIGGTAAGLASAMWVPYTMFRRQVYAPGAAFGGWLMPVVPPMVSATTGALLAEQLALGPTRTTLIALCYSMFGLSLLASVPVVALIARRLTRTDVGPAAAVPTLWIVLGPLGQSIAAANGLALAVPRHFAVAAADFALVYGLGTFAVALLWLGVAATITFRTLRVRLPFSLSWWSFTFPVGTVVLGSSALAARTGLGVLSWFAVGLYAALVVAWIVVLARTATNVRRLLA